ncbi:MAG: peptidoglycan DD-metalloendopeptidase family protein [Rikenellaceae bacterium]|nr:peptidoglycan DD-metalloendopeptidase family protein [Rikenellaceae bacterium]
MAIRKRVKKETRIAPWEEPRKRFRRKAARLVIHLLGWIGMAVLFYIGFSFFFDTPLEYRMKSSTSSLRREYERLDARYDSLETVLLNVVDRDKNVFRILFEADPYDFDSHAQQERWTTYERLLSKSNNELNTELSSRTAALERRIAELESTYTDMENKLGAAGDKVNSIPSIQPVINKDLTLLTASFGLRIHPFYKTLTPHMGVDYTVPEGSRVFATADGKVKDVSAKATTSGITVIISHGNGYETQYNHLGQLYVKKGDQVRRGDIIALSGNTGLSLAPHLHYEVRHHGMRIDPIHYFFMDL